MRIMLVTSGWSVNDKREREIDLSDYFEEDEIEGKTEEEVIAMIYADNTLCRDMLETAIEQHNFEWSLKGGTP